MTLKGNQKWAVIRNHLIHDEDGYNAEVEAHFGNTSQDESRNQAKNLCLVASTDSERIATQKKDFFYYQVLKIQRKPIIIGQPKTDVDATMKYHPQVVVYLEQDSQSLSRGQRPKEAEFSWRLLSHTSYTITTDILNYWARKVYDNYFNPQPYTFNKGKYIGWYESPKDGVHLQLYTYDEQTAEAVAKKILGSIDKQFDDNIFKTTKPKRSNTEPLEQITILGKQKNAPQWRPNITVYAKRAYINIWSDDDIHPIVERVGNKFVPIIRQT